MPPGDCWPTESFNLLQHRSCLHPLYFLKNLSPTEPSLKFYIFRYSPRWIEPSLQLASGPRNGAGGHGVSGQWSCKLTHWHSQRHLFSSVHRLSSSSLPSIGAKPEERQVEWSLWAKNWKWACIQQTISNLPQCLPNCACNMSAFSSCLKMQRVLVEKVTIMNSETRMFSSKSNTSY